MSRKTRVRMRAWRVGGGPAPSPARDSLNMLLTLLGSWPILSPYSTKAKSQDMDHPLKLKKSVLAAGLASLLIGAAVAPATAAIRPGFSLSRETSSIFGPARTAGFSLAPSSERAIVSGEQSPPA